ncbi:MAG: class III poly(R)-hydroxyalkanoic acid synthase subunit PhaC [Deltaproteobacteria bacterium]|nr:class III poly(R)-hydroxyalkanoic acid synthase subunit PhaC [Deltaproteobacteria bacterium]
MSVIQIPPERATAEALRLNRKLLKGLHALEDLGEIHVGPTPKEEVYRDEKVVLYRYRPQVPKPHAVPVLIVYALVNRPYMVDLENGRSLVSALLREGLDVYLIDWGYPTRCQRYLTLEDYIGGYIDDCVDQVRRRSSADRINLLGICQGGVFSLCYAALNPEKIKNLVTMVTAVDFHVPDGLLNVWARALDVDLMVDALGNVPGELLNSAFLMLKPWQLMVQKYIGALEVLDDEENLRSFLKMEKWIFDSPDQAGEAFRQFVKDFYQGNKLVKGELFIGEERVDLKRVTMPVLNVYATADHLVPPSSSKNLDRFVGSSDVTTIPFPGGHIGIYVSSKAQKELAPALTAWLKARG